MSGQSQKSYVCTLLENEAGLEEIKCTHASKKEEDCSNQEGLCIEMTHVQLL